MKNLFFKVVCVDESDPFEYRVLEEANRGSLKEVHDFVNERLEQHEGAKWMLIPFSCKAK